MRFSQTLFCSACGLLQADSHLPVALAVPSGATVDCCGGTALCSGGLGLTVQDSEESPPLYVCLCVGKVGVVNLSVYRELGAWGGTCLMMAP